MSLAIAWCVTRSQHGKWMITIIPINAPRSTTLMGLASHFKSSGWSHITHCHLHVNTMEHGVWCMGYVQKLVSTPRRNTGIELTVCMCVMIGEQPSKLTGVLHGWHGRENARSTDTCPGQITVTDQSRVDWLHMCCSVTTSPVTGLIWKFCWPGRGIWLHL